VFGFGGFFFFFFFFFNLLSPASRYGLGVDSACNRNFYIPGIFPVVGKGRPARRTENLTAICELIV
jgi:hypothetical protein